MCLFRCYIWTNQVFSKRLYIIWEVLYSITWIPWRSILVNINFHVIQFSLMSVFFKMEWKLISLIFAFFPFSRKQFLKKFWSYLKAIDWYFIVWSILTYIIGRNFVGKNFSTGQNWGYFIKNVITFPRLYFSQLTFCYFVISNFD